MWEDGMPQRQRRLTYYGFADEQYYSLKVDGQAYKALYYEGEFNRGNRSGEGVVVYESGFKDEGIFNGPWADGVIFFQGKKTEKKGVFILTFMPCKNIIISIEVNEKKGNYCGSN